MRKSVKYSPELRERAIRLVGEQRGEHESQWAAVVFIAGKVGCTPQTLLTWVRQHEKDAGQRSGVTTAEQDRVSWFNHRRLLSSIGYIPPAEAEAVYYQQQKQQTQRQEDGQAVPA